MGTGSQALGDWRPREVLPMASMTSITILKPFLNDIKTILKRYVSDLFRICFPEICICFESCRVQRQIHFPKVDNFQKVVVYGGKFIFRKFNLLKVVVHGGKFMFRKFTFLKVVVYWGKFIFRKLTFSKVAVYGGKSIFWKVTCLKVVVYSWQTHFPKIDIL